MGRNKVQTLLMASMTIMLCMAMLVCGTYALWSKKVEVTNHLVAGSLDLELWRTSLSKTVPDEDGYMKTTTDTSKVDLTKGSNVNVFGIGKDELIVPTSAYEATLQIKNTGTVAFTYQIIIKLVEVDDELAGQLMVSVNGTEKGYLSSFSAADGQVVVASDVAKGKETTFKVKVEFKNDVDVEGIVNNDAMDKSAEFDLIVNAVQATTQQQ